MQIMLFLTNIVYFKYLNETKVKKRILFLKHEINFSYLKNSIFKYFIKNFEPIFLFFLYILIIFEFISNKTNYFN